MRNRWLEGPCLTQVPPSGSPVFTNAVRASRSLALITAPKPPAPAPIATRIVVLHGAGRQGGTRRIDVATSVPRLDRLQNPDFSVILTPSRGLCAVFIEDPMRVFEPDHFMVLHEVDTVDAKATKRFVQLSCGLDF